MFLRVSLLLSFSLLFFLSHRGEVSAACVATDPLNFEGDVSTTLCQMQSTADASLCLMSTAVTALETAAPGYVTLSGGQTITGVKTFSSGLTAASVVGTTDSNQIVFDMPGSNSVTWSFTPPVTPNAQYIYTLPDVAGDTVVLLSNTAVQPQPVNSQLYFTQNTNQLVFGVNGDTQTTLNVPVPSGVRTYTVPDTGVSSSFVLTKGGRTVSGVITFNQTVTSTDPIQVASTANIDTATPAAGDPSVHFLGGAGAHDSVWVGDGLYIGNILGSTKLSYATTKLMSITWSTHIANTVVTGNRFVYLGNLRMLRLQPLNGTITGVGGTFFVSDNFLSAAGYAPTANVRCGARIIRDATTFYEGYVTVTSLGGVQICKDLNCATTFPAGSGTAGWDKEIVITWHV